MTQQHFIRRHPASDRNGLSTIIVAAALLFLSHTALSAQDIIDGFTRGQRNSDLAITFSAESYDAMWMGATEVPLPPPLGTISTTSLNTFLAHGITNDIDLVAQVSHVSTAADGDGTGPPDQSGFQDGQLHIKWRPWHQPIGESMSFDLVTSAGVSGPLTDYVSDAPVAIGHSSTNVELRAIGMLRMESGPFLAATIGYSRRDGINPDVAISGVRLGYAHEKFYAEGWLFNQNGQSGTDIGEGTFPSNRMNYMRAGLKASFAPVRWLAINAGGWTTLDGRNIGKATGFGGGLTLRLEEMHRALIGN